MALFLIRDYDELGQSLSKRLREQRAGPGVREALDALGCDPPIAYHAGPPSKAPVDGLELRRQRLMDFDEKIRHDDNATKALDRLERYALREELKCLAYQARRRGQIAFARIGVDRDLCAVATGKATGGLALLNRIDKRMEALDKLLLRAERIADGSEPLYNRSDPVRPPRPSSAAIDAILAYLQQFAAPTFPPIIGAPGHGVALELAAGSALGALAVIMQGLAGAERVEDRVFPDVAKLAGAGSVLNRKWTARTVRDRCDIFLRERGRVRGER
jgi:hypothetical protein